MIEIFRTLFYVPLYNALIGLIDIVPGGSVGFAVVILTIGVKVLLLPLSVRASKTQIEMKKIEPEVSAIKKKYPKREEQARHIMELYRTNKINPFASILVLLAQLPIFFALYFVFFKGGLPTINEDLLYSFISVPENVSMMFLGIDMAGRSLFLSLFAGGSQFVQAYFAMPESPPRTAEAGFAEEFARSMHIQARYVLPLIVGIVAYTISSAVALYLVTSNMVAILQEWYVRNPSNKPHESK